MSGTGTMRAESSWPWRLAAWGALLLATGVLYAGNVTAPLVFDDLDFFAGNYVSLYGSSVQPFLPRFWPYATFAHQSMLFGHGVAETHFGNILLHGLCAVALQALIARLLAAFDGTGDAPPTVRHELVALSAAGLFAVHPVAVYAVAYLIQRSMLMATLFSLLMWHAYLAALQTEKKGWLWISVLCYYFAAYSKQHAVLAPLVPLVLSFLFWRHNTQAQARMAKIPWRWLAPVFGAYAVIAIGVTLPSASLLGTNYEPMLAYFLEGTDWHERLFLLQRIHWMSVLTQCGLFFKYLSLWLWPNPAAMSADMRETFVTDLSDPGNWFGVVFYLAYGMLATGLLLRGRRNRSLGLAGLLGLGLLVPWGLFLVELMSVRLQEIFVLYRSYLWATGLAIAFAAVLNAVTARLRFVGIVLACVPVPLAGMLAFAAEQRLQTFRSEKLLWSDAVRLIEQRNVPVVGAERAYNNRGVAYAREKDYRRALADYAKALTLNPRYYPSHQSRGQVYEELGQFEDALASYDTVLAIRPSFTRARLSRAGVLERIGRKDEALAELKRACDEGDAWGCYLHQKRIDPTADFVFKPKPATPN